jgi:ribosomal protein L31
VYTYNASGLRLNKYEYRSGWAAPVKSVVNAGAKVAAPKTAAVSEALNSEFKMYPNPVSDVLNIDVPSSNSNTLEIYAIDGKKVYTKSVNGTNTTQVDVSKFSKGMYILKLLSTDSEEIVSKFIVK